MGGLALGLIALLSSYDHVTLLGRTLRLQQQWGIPFIAASVAIVFVVAEGFCEAVAELATRSRLRAAHERARDQDSENEERNRADQERDRADRERYRAAEVRERQARNAEFQNAELALLRRSDLLSARVLLDPSESNRARLRAFLALISRPPEEGLI